MFFVVFEEFWLLVSELKQIMLDEYDGKNVEK